MMHRARNVLCYASVLLIAIACFRYFVEYEMILKHFKGESNGTIHVKWEMPPNQPELAGQPFLAVPRFNLGGDSAAGQSYREFFIAHENQEPKIPAAELWQLWKQHNNNDTTKSTVIKLIMMTKNEWPLIHRWVMYHGKLIGFQNLYILDASTDEECVSFLRHARDNFGANVIFTKANLNEVEAELSYVAQALAGSAHVIIKMDTDEFLAVNTENSTCISSSSPSFSLSSSTTKQDETNLTDCTISPYGVTEYLNSESFRNELNGNMLKIGYAVRTSISEEYCKSGKGAIYYLGSEITYDDDNELVGFHHYDPSVLNWYKAVFDARTISKVNLGGHAHVPSDVLPPFHVSPDKTKLGIIHFHYRCPEDIFKIDRKAVRSHGFVWDNETDQEAVLRFKKALGKEKLCGLGVYHIINVTKSGISFHKVANFLAFLDECPGVTSIAKMPESTRRNPDFYHFLKVAMSVNNNTI